MNDNLISKSACGNAGDFVEGYFPFDAVWHEGGWRGYIYNIFIGNC
jgi:hypothetical protein